MQYTTEIEIYLPREKVIELFANPNNIAKWMTGFQNVTIIKGKPNKTGTESKLLFNFNGRKLEMLETIVNNNLPDSIKLLYASRGVNHNVTSRFYDDGQFTKWEMKSEFQFTGIMKLFGFISPEASARHIVKNMYHFKKFAESNNR